MSRIAQHVVGGAALALVVAAPLSTAVAATPIIINSSLTGTVYGNGSGTNGTAAPISTSPTDDCGVIVSTGGAVDGNVYGAYLSLSSSNAATRNIQGRYTKNVDHHA